MTDIISIMPKMLTGEELDKALEILPEYDDSVREKDVPKRLVALQDIYRIFIPSAMSREIYSKMYLSLLRSLQKKQSILAVRQYSENSKMIRQQSYESIIGGSDSFTVIGESGIGKSSSVSRAVNLLCDVPVLEVENTKIIPCLQVQAPADSSIKGLLLEILRKADEFLGTRYHENAIRSHATTDMLIGTVSQIALNHIGLLIVDEIQNIVNSKNGRNSVGALTQLINNSGVSIAMVGTPECTLFFEQAFMLARRSLGVNYSAMEYGDEFRNFCRTLLRYCYVNVPPTIDEELLLWLYNHSKGNASVVANLIHDGQEIAILEGTERLNIAILAKVFKSRMTMLHDFLTPEKTKAPPPKKKKVKRLEVRENYIGDSISIFEVSSNAKMSGCNIVSELKKVGIEILEVAI